MPSYATVQDMIDRFGQTEMIRLTTPADQGLDGVVMATAEAKLADASALMDTYVGRRYQVPMDVPPQIIVSGCCNIARYYLAQRENTSPTEDMRRAYDDAMAFLRDVSLGKAVLELDEVEASQESYAMASTREPVFGSGRGGWL